MVDIRKVRSRLRSTSRVRAAQKKAVPPTRSTVHTRDFSVPQPAPVVWTGHREHVTIGMASMPEREAGMLATVERLLPHCNAMIISLNGYPKNYRMPISDPKLQAVPQPAALGPRGKFLYAANRLGYYLSVDDDIVYPDNYVQDIVDGINRYERVAYVGYHGKLMTFAAGSADLRRCLFSHEDLVTNDVPVHILGTGLFGYHSDAGTIDASALQEGMIDNQVAFMAQERRAPMIVLRHPKDWAPDDPKLFRAGTAMHQNSAAVQRFNRTVSKYEWKLYTPANWRKHNR